MISIGIPNYNSGPFLKETLESILAQTFQSFEVIVTDDNSTDESFQLAQKLKDPRIRFYEGSKNRGPQIQRNEQLALATYPLFAVMDADDLWHPTKLARQFDFMQANQDIFACGCAINKGEVPFDRENLILKKPLTDPELKTNIFWETPIWNNTLIFRTEIAKKNNLGWDQNEHAEDQSFLLKAARNGLKFANLIDNLCFYRVHSGQMSLSPKLEASALRQRLKLLQHQFPTFQSDECTDLLLRGNTDYPERLKQFRAFAKLQKACVQGQHSFRYPKQMEKRCDIAVIELAKELFPQLPLRDFTPLVKSIFRQVRRKWTS